MSPASASGYSRVVWRLSASSARHQQGDQDQGRQHAPGGGRGAPVEHEQHDHREGAVRVGALAQEGRQAAPHRCAGRVVPGKPGRDDEHHAVADRGASPPPRAAVWRSSRPGLGRGTHRVGLREGVHDGVARERTDGQCGAPGEQKSEPAGAKSLAPPATSQVHRQRRRGPGRARRALSRGSSAGHTMSCTKPSSSDCMIVICAASFGNRLLRTFAQARRARPSARAAPSARGSCRRRRWTPSPRRPPPHAGTAVCARRLASTQSAWARGLAEQLLGGPLGQVSKRPRGRPGQRGEAWRQALLQRGLHVHVREQLVRRGRSPPGRGSLGSRSARCWSGPVLGVQELPVGPEREDRQERQQRRYDYQDE